MKRRARPTAMQSLDSAIRQMLRHGHLIAPLSLQRTRRGLQRLIDIGERVESFLVDCVHDDAVGAQELLAELRTALREAGGAT